MKINGRKMKVIQQPGETERSIAMRNVQVGDGIWSVSKDE